MSRAVASVACVALFGLSGCENPKAAKDAHDLSWGAGRDFVIKRTSQVFEAAANRETGRGNAKGAAAILTALSYWRAEVMK